MQVSRMFHEGFGTLEGLLHSAWGWTVARKFDQVAVLQERFEQVAVGGNQPAGGQGGDGDEELFGGLFWGTQAEAQLDIPSQNRGHTHIKLLNAFLANEILTLQVFQGRESEHVGWALQQQPGRSALPTSIPPPAASEKPHPSKPTSN